MDHIIIMGQSHSSMYQNGDIPRDTMDILGNSKGYAYYSSSVEGKCSECSEKTTWWFVDIKSKGKYICQSCNFNKKHSRVNDRKNLEESRISYY